MYKIEKNGVEVHLYKLKEQSRMIIDFTKLLIFMEESKCLDIAKKCIVVGIIKDLYEQGLLTEDEMKVAIIEIDKDYERKVA